MSRTLTAALVEAFRARFPRATLSMLEGLSTYTLEWLVQGRIDCAVVYNATPTAAVDLQPVLEEPLYLVSARGVGAAGPLVGRAVPLADVARHGLVIPSRPHAIRMRLETVLAEAGLKPSVALEIESVPAILELVQRHPMHAVLSLNAVRGSGHEAAYVARPIRLGAGAGRLATTLYIATSAQRPRGALLDQAVVLVAGLLAEHVGGGGAARSSIIAA